GTGGAATSGATAPTGATGGAKSSSASNAGSEISASVNATSANSTSVSVSGAVTAGSGGGAAYVAQVQVSVPAGTFSIDATEVTNAAYADFLASNPTPTGPP